MGGKLHPTGGCSSDGPDGRTVDGVEPLIGTLPRRACSWSCLRHSSSSGAGGGETSHQWRRHHQSSSASLRSRHRAGSQRWLSAPSHVSRLEAGCACTGEEEPPSRSRTVEHARLPVRLSTNGVRALEEGKEDSARRGRTRFGQPGTRGLNALSGHITDSDVCKKIVIFRG